MASGVYPRPSVATRFWAKVNKTRGCWLWRGHVGNHGYGEVSLYEDGIRVKRTTSNRMAYQLGVGPIPAGLHVLHRCDVPLCCNPKHLFLGTMRDNMIDKRDKARGNTKLNREDVIQIRGLALEGRKSSWISEKFGISRRQVWQVTSRRCWRDVR